MQVYENTKGEEDKTIRHSSSNSSKKIVVHCEEFCYNLLHCSGFCICQSISL